MTITWQNDCQVPTSGTPDNTNTGTGTNIVNGGTNSALASSGSVGTGNTFASDSTVLPTVTGLTINRCWRYVQAGANQVTEYADGTAGQTHFKWFSLVNLDAAPAASLSWGRAYIDTGHATIAFTWQVTTTRKVHVSELSGSTSTDSAGQLTPATWYLEAFEYDQAAKTATISYYAIGSQNATATSTLSGVTGTYSLISVRHGIGTASAFTNQGFRRCLIQMGDVNVQRPDIVATAPVADAGPDQVNVEPWSLVTLDGSASYSPSGAAITTNAWTQTAGPTVTLSDPTAAQPTFAPAGAITDTSYMFSLTVTDANGLTSSANTCLVNVLAATEYYLSLSGVWTAGQPMSL